MSSKGTSINRRLLLTLLPTITLVWLVVAVLVYLSAQHEVQEVFDADLARSARILHTLLAHEVNEERQGADRAREVITELGPEGMQRYPQLAALLRDYLSREHKERLELVSNAQQAGLRYGAGLIFVVRYADGNVMLRDRAAPEVPLTAAGYRDVDLQGERWRIYRFPAEDAGFVVQVGERHAFRDELVGYITRNTLLPLLLALPLLAVLIWGGIRRALVPLQRVANQVATRAVDALEPIDARDSPREIHSLLLALNHLFERVRAAILRERQFTADAAHELRTPLAALKAHLQVARAQSSAASIAHSLDQALAGVDRATHSVTQLLAMARADAETTRTLLSGEVDLQELAVWVVSALSQQAVERDIDLGVEAARPAPVQGDREALQIVLRNLVDNAIHYTPVGGIVTVAVGQDDTASWIAVLDNGHGLPASERERVFGRFYRGASGRDSGGTGSGLGLSIVQRICRQHHAELVLGEGIDRCGLGVRIVFPLLGRRLPPSPEIN